MIVEVEQKYNIYDIVKLNREKKFSFGIHAAVGGIMFKHYPDEDGSAGATGIMLFDDSNSWIEYEENIESVVMSGTCKSVKEALAALTALEKLLGSDKQSTKHFSSAATTTMLTQGQIATPALLNPSSMARAMDHMLPPSASITTPTFMSEQIKKWIKFITKIWNR